MGQTEWLVVAVIYMLPTIVGAQRNHANLSAISIINVLLGWTLIGWVVALVMAVWQQPKPVQRQQSVAPNYDAQTGRKL